jgi:two-component sensor histidine kinase
VREAISSLRETLPKRLTARLVALMTLALFPLGLMSILQTRAVVQEADALRQEALLTETLAAAEAEQRLIQEGIGIAEALAALVPTLPRNVCTPAMQQVVDANAQVVFAGFVPIDGQMTCSSAGQAIDLTGMPDFAEDVRREDLGISINLQGAVTRQSVVILSYPVFAQGRLRGQMTVSVPHTIAATGMSARGRDDGLKLASFDASGGLIAASQGLDAASGFLPAEAALQTLPPRSGTTFRAEAGDGRDRLYAVATLRAGKLYLVGSWPSVTPGSGAVDGLTAMLLPVAMWFAGVSVAIFGLQRLVVRHISGMRSAMRRFGLGERGEGLLELDDPPLEIEELERAFNRMALIVTDAEARREADLQDKEVLLKEVHHRVKNNLQLIASIMNLQIRRAHSPEAKRLLTGLQRRVRGLAMLHRSLYTTPDMTTIDSRDLISTVVQDASSLMTDRKQRVETELASLDLYPDQAVPLSMLIAEALTNAFKYGDVDADEPIRVVLEDLGGERARLFFSNPVQTGTEIGPAEGDGLGTQLMTAFVRQLEGESRTAIEDGRYIFEATFARRGFETMSAA